MVKVQSIDNKPTWFSEDNDWNSANGYTIAVWAGCILSQEHYPDFVEFVETEAGAKVEPVGSFKTAEDLPVFVFLVKSNISKFSIWRLNHSGMRWWFDMFSYMNNGEQVAEEEILPVIEKLGLKVNVNTQQEIADVYDED